MSHIAIEKVHNGQENECSLMDDLKGLTSRIRDRAFEIFQRRTAGSDDAALHDWLEAERALAGTGKSDLIEREGEFELRVAVPGFAEKDLKVTAMADALVVVGESAHRHEGEEGNVCFCEFDEKQFFRRFDLPHAIDVDKVTARLDKGILQLTAAKTQTTKVSAATVA